MLETVINGRWRLLLPEHRAARPEWPWWEAHRLAAMATVIGAGHVVWDVGAEEGDLPALWAMWGADVVLAEPNPLVWPNIKAIWKANGLPDPAWCWPGFLADRSTVSAPQARSIGGPWPACADGPVIGDHGFARVEERPDLPAVTIDHLVGAGVPAPTVITMDVEGAEHLVLAGAADTLRAHRPHVFVSVHPEFMAHHYGVAEGVQVVRDLMAGYGYPPDAHEFLATDHEHHWWFRP